MAGNQTNDKSYRGDDLIQAIIQTEAEIEKAERQKASAEKRMNQIRSSNTFKAAGRLKNFIAKNDRRLEFEMLEKELEDVRGKLQETYMELQLARLDDRTMNSVKIQRMVKEMKDEAAILGYINEAIKQKKKHDENYRDALTYAARLFKDRPPEYRHSIYSKMLEGMKVEDIPEFMMREALLEEPLQLKQAASFRASLNMRIRRSQLGFMPPEYMLDDKQRGYAFADKLKVRRPWVSENTYTVDALPFEPGTVVKPVDGAGARGVYLIHDTNDIMDIKQGRGIKTSDDLIESMKNDLISGRVEKDDWMMEELILDDGSQARDVKFYCFYGKVGVILEIERYPELKYCWWTAENERIVTGKYDNSPFKGKGVDSKEVAMAEMISAQVPAPFIRIDFLRSDEGLILGEFTPKPGNYDEFDAETDQYLGDLFLEAEGRLMQDLASSVSFEAFKSLSW